MRPRNARLLVALSAAALAWPGGVLAVTAADKVNELQARFDHETNSVHKAKLLEKLGDEQFAETRRASHENDYVTVGQVMEKYRDNARLVMDALKKEHPDAERQMGGYKQLQIHIHRGIRELNELLVLAPTEYRPPLELVHQDLVSMDDELLLRLFPPRREKKKPGAPPPASDPPEKQP
jgi:hypothetical protein